MNKTVVLLVLVLGFICVNRLPAPIVEEQEKPTPVPEQSEAPAKKTKHSTKARPSAVESSEKSETRPTATPAPALNDLSRFAGTWQGKVNQGLLGHTPTTLMVNSAATSVELSHNVGGKTRPVTLSGNTISWQSGMVGEVSWTLTPNSDAQTAQVTMKGLLINDTETFRRGQISSGSSSPTQNTTSQSHPTSTTSSAQLSSAAGGSITGPRPNYSQTARNAHLSGTGTYVLHFDTATGNVTDVTVSQSTGSAALDQAAIDAFRQWHAQPNGKKEFSLTISFP
jgi:TonB family protein